MKGAMSCCDAYGQCNQGRDCPARPRAVLHKQAENALHAEAHECAAEGGNVWFDEPEPQIFTKAETIIVFTVTAILVIASIVAVAGLMGWIYQVLKIFLGV